MSDSSRLRTRVSVRIPQFGVLIVMISLLLTLAPAAHAYDDDTHYWLTYYLARKVGYTREQADRIAAADLSVDYSPQTNPLFPHTIHPSHVRADLHAFPSTKAVKKCRSEARKSNPALKLKENKRQLEEAVNRCVEPLQKKEQGELWEAAINSGNPGVFLHFYQDLFSHRGFTSRIGHYRAGHLPDFLASDPERAHRMATETVCKLREFMAQHWHLAVLPPEPDSQEISDIVDQFISANPTGVRLNEYYSDWDWDSSDLTWEKIRELRRNAGDSIIKPWKVPDSFIAFRLVHKALPGDVLPEIRVYALKQDGSLDPRYCLRKLVNQTNKHGISLLVPEEKQRKCGDHCDCTDVHWDLGESPIS